jgi:hypothetical protein
MERLPNFYPGDRTVDGKPQPRETTAQVLPFSRSGREDDRNEASHQVSETLRGLKGSSVQTLDCQVNAFLSPWKIIRSPCTQNNT